VSLVTFPDHYTVIEEYTNVIDSTNKHRNTFDFYATVPPTSSDALITALGELAPHLAMATFNYTRVAVYNWSRGVNPYPSGSPIFEESASIACDAETAWDFAGSSLGATPTGKEICLRVDREPGSPGRNGRLFLRGLLSVESIQSPGSGDWIFTTDGADVFNQTKLDSLLTSTGVADYFGAGTGGMHLCMVRYGPKHGGIVSEASLNGFTLIGPTTSKSTRKSHR